VSDVEIPLDVYIDTNALRSLNFRTHISRLLFASKSGKIKLRLCELVLWERARQYFEMESDRDRLIIVTADLPKVVAWFKKVFEEHGAEIIETELAHVDDGHVVLSEDTKYFRIGNGNDRRDALIFAVGRLALRQENALILCQEKLLSAAFEQEGYRVRGDAKQYVEEITADLEVPQLIRPDIALIDDYNVRNALSQYAREFLRTSDDAFMQYERALPAVTDLLVARLAHIQGLDQEVRQKILGYASWFDPVSKEDLGRLLSNRYALELIENNAQRLCQDGLLVEAGAYWLINGADGEAKEVGAQAMGSVMPEILEITGLN